MWLMTDKRIRHLPVAGEDGGLAGIVSIGDVVKHRLGQLETENQALYEYITHGR
jgi:CBS domain-containing protein